MKKWIGWLLVLVVILVLGGFLLSHPKDVLYDHVQATTQDLTTYYSFSGNVEAKDAQSLISTTMFQVNEILVEEGQWVEKGEVLLTTSQGMKLEASVSGEVSTIYVREGDLVTSGTPLVDVTDYEHLQIKVKVDEYNIIPVSVGKEVSVHVNALNQDYSGSISHVTKEAQISSGIAYFIATVDIEENANLYIGMSSEVKLVNESVTDAIVLPMDAIQFKSDETPYVYYQNENDEVISKDITVGISDGVYVQVLSGVNQGEDILVPKAIEIKTPFEMMKHSNK